MMGGSRGSMGGARTGIGGIWLLPIGRGADDVFYSDSLLTRTRALSEEQRSGNTPHQLRPKSPCRRDCPWSRLHSHNSSCAHISALRPKYRAMTARGWQPSVGAAALKSLGLFWHSVFASVENYRCQSRRTFYASTCVDMSVSRFESEAADVSVSLLLIPTPIIIKESLILQ